MQLDRRPRALVACEYSGRVRDALTRIGFDAVSYDLLPTEKPGPHVVGDVVSALGDGWDLLIGHPPCTYLALAGVRWLYHPEDTHLPPDQRRRHPNYPNRMQDLEDGLKFFERLRDAPVPYIALENSTPHGLAIARIGRPDQRVQPWWFGDPYTKAACWWLKNLPPLQKTMVVPPHLRMAACHLASPGPDRWKERSRTHPRTAMAYAAQWGGYVLQQLGADNADAR